MRAGMLLVTAADSAYFEFVRACLQSVRDQPAGRKLPIAFLDLGCTREQLDWLAALLDHVVRPAWEFDFRGRAQAPAYLRGLLGEKKGRARGLARLLLTNQPRRRSILLSCHALHEPLLAKSVTMSSIGANGRRRVFHKHGDYQAFLKALAHACIEIPMPVLGFCVMPNHCHLVVLPKQRPNPFGIRSANPPCGGW